MYLILCIRFWQVSLKAIITWNRPGALDAAKTILQFQNTTKTCKPVCIVAGNGLYIARRRNGQIPSSGDPRLFPSSRDCYRDMTYLYEHNLIFADDPASILVVGSLISWYRTLWGSNKMSKEAGICECHNQLRTEIELNLCWNHYGNGIGHRSVSIKALRTNMWILVSNYDDFNDPCGWIITAQIPWASSQSDSESQWQSQWSGWVSVTVGVSVSDCFDSMTVSVCVTASTL